MKTVSFTIRRKYFDAIVAGAKKEEIRADIPRWRWLIDDPPDQVIFLCGRDKHRRFVERTYREHPHVVLGRPVSQQGVEDLGLVSSRPEDSRMCIVVKLGEEVLVECPQCGKKDKISIVPDHTMTIMTIPATSRVYKCERCKLIFGDPLREWK